MSRSRLVARASARFLGSVILTSGVLLIADAAITLAWQEPVTALIAKRQQARLEDQLGGAARLAARDSRELAATALRRRLSLLAGRQARRTRVGRATGRIELPTLDRSYAMVEGTDRATLRKGPGHYPGTPLPGQRGTFAVAGHRTTYLAPFRAIDRLRQGDRVVAAMPYGRFTYRVERTRIVRPTALWVIRRARHDRLVLSACHPLYSAEKRIVVFARLSSFRPA